MSAEPLLRSEGYEPELSREVTPGACVCLKSGGPLMLVVRPVEDADAVLCLWLLDDRPTLTSAEFKKDALRVVHPNPTCARSVDGLWSNSGSKD